MLGIFERKIDLVHDEGSPRRRKYNQGRVEPPVLENFVKFKLQRQERRKISIKWWQEPQGRLSFKTWILRVFLCCRLSHHVSHLNEVLSSLGIHFVREQT